MKLLFELSHQGHGMDYLPKCEVKDYDLDEKYLRKLPSHLPELSEVEVVRHYTNLEKETYGVNNGFYPLGSCTMKYNPAALEVSANYEGFTQLHPFEEEEDVQGALEVYDRLGNYLKEITGMDKLSFLPAAGAHGEFTGMLMIKKYFALKNDTKRTKIIIPDSAHGTNPASAAMCGYEVITLPSKDGYVDLEELSKLMDETVAGLMLTNPNTLGLYDPGILEITKIVHQHGGLVYYDGANLNAIMGHSRPGDMGFDLCHLNLHKTFGTPHGGGGPGAGVIASKEFLAPYLPNPLVEKLDGEYTFVYSKHSIGKVKRFFGNFLVVVKALTYVELLGGEGLKDASGNAVLNANYLMRKLEPEFHCAYDHTCMHEFVLDLSKLKEEKDISALDVAKGLIDYGVHPPTMYFPMIVHEALMIEPTETEGKDTLDQFSEDLKEVIKKDAQSLHTAPNTTKYSRLDEVMAARHPVLTYEFKD